MILGYLFPSRNRHQCYAVDKLNKKKLNKDVNITEKKNDDCISFNLDVQITSSLEDGFPHKKSITDYVRQVY